MIGDKRYKFTRAHLGNQRSLGETRNVLAISYGHTDYKKAPAAASATAIQGSQAAPTAATVVPITPNPDVPRRITITLGGTTANILAGTIVVTGTNVEGKVITDNIAVTAATGGTLSTTKAFKTISTIGFPVGGASVTYTVGVAAGLGIFHRLPTVGTDNVRVVTQTPAGVRTLQAAPTVTQSTTLIENNVVVPAVAPNGTNTFSIHYYFTQWALDPNPNGTTAQLYGVK